MSSRIEYHLLPGLQYNLLPELQYHLLPGFSIECVLPGIQTLSIKDLDHTVYLRVPNAITHRDAVTFHQQCA